MGFLSRCVLFALFGVLLLAVLGDARCDMIVKGLDKNGALVPACLNRDDSKDMDPSYRSGPQLLDEPLVCPKGQGLDSNGQCVDVFDK